MPLNAKQRNRVESTHNLCNSHAMVSLLFLQSTIRDESNRCAVTNTLFLLQLMEQRLTWMAEKVQLEGMRLQFETVQCKGNAKTRERLQALQGSPRLQI